MCTRMRTSSRAHVCVCVCVRERVRACVRVCVYVCVRARVYAQMPVHEWSHHRHGALTPNSHRLLLPTATGPNNTPRVDVHVRLRVRVVAKNKTARSEAALHALAPTAPRHHAAPSRVVTSSDEES